MTHPAILNARELLELEEQHRQAQTHDWDARLRRAIMLAPTIQVCEALLLGEAVPISQLNPEWVRRYGIRRAS